jgi:type VII secretion-associated serine protease mycosin
MLQIRTASLGTLSLVTAVLAGCGSNLVPNQPLQTAAQRPSMIAQAAPGQLIVKFKATPRSGMTTLGRTLSANDALGYSVVTVAPGKTVEQTMADLAKDPAVEWAEPNWLFSAPNPFERRNNAPRKAPRLGFGTNDPVAKQQWHAPKINAEQAWKVSTGKNVVVAVVDTGMDLDHPDLKANLVPGYNTLEENNNPHDDNGHGTHVAGIIGAIANNGIGAAGVAPNVKIMPIRALGDQGGSAQSVAAAIQYAADHGAHVMNLSLGSPRSSKVIETAIKYALKKGVSVVAAMGNSGDQGNPRMYPASYPGVVAVGALDPDDKPTSWSDWGDWQAVSAPGYGIWSTFPTYETSLYRIAKQNPGALPPECKIELGYSAVSGTSQASPVVAGVVALLKSLDPAMSPAQVRDRIMKSARDLGPGGFDPHHGAGMVDALAAVR